MHINRAQIYHTCFSVSILVIFTAVDYQDFQEVPLCYEVSHAP
jgi:hypothetical protein